MNDAVHDSTHDAVHDSTHAAASFMLLQLRPAEGSSSSCHPVTSDPAAAACMLNRGRGVLQQLHGADQSQEAPIPRSADSGLSLVSS